MSASQQHDTVKVSQLRPADAEGDRRRGHGARRDPAAPRRRRATRRKAFGSSELLVADRIANTAEEAKAIAQSTLDKLASGSFEAEGVMEGDPRVKAGGKLKLEGFGPASTASTTSASVTHVYGHGDFRTRFAISGRNPRTLTDVMRPKAERDWTAGLVIGLVTNNQDPEKLGRVRVKFPALGDDIEGSWARIALPGAGKDAGMAFLPMVGDEVVVGFEHGDTRRPVVLGCLHNTIDKPHDEDGRRQGRRLARGLRPQGRRDQLGEAARDRRQGADGRSRSTAATDGRGDYSARRQGQVRDQGRQPRSRSRAPAT